MSPPRGWTLAPRHVALGFVLVLGFFAEGSGVSIEKRLLASVAEQSSFSADDGRAMAWLKQNASAGSVLINDGTVDAGIWAPYKADVPILLPRSASAQEQVAREPILTHLLDLTTDPSVRTALCQSGADYVYSGARPLEFEARQLPDREVLARTPYLREVFSSGDAAIYAVNVGCGQVAQR